MRQTSRLLAPLLCLAAGFWTPPAPRAQTLFWTDTNFGAPTLNRANADGLGLVTLALSPGTLPEGVALDLAQPRLYWVESAFTGARVMQANVDFTGVTPLLTGGSCERGLAVDAAADKLYWTTSNLVSGSTVRVANSNGTGEQVLLNLGASANPRGIALDATNGRVYWADFDQNLIRRANLNGSQAATIVTLPPDTGPLGVDYVISTEQVYWTEYNAGRIRRSSADGASVTTLVSGLANPTYLALDANGSRMFWIEAAAGGQRLRRANLDGSGVTTLPVPISTYGGIAFRPGLPVDVDVSAPVTDFALEPVSPNPAPGVARIAFALPRESHVRLSVLDVQGREVARLLDAVRPAGRHRVEWSGRTTTGAKASPGLYFVRLRTAGREWSRRVVLVE